MTNEKTSSSINPPRDDLKLVCDSILFGGSTYFISSVTTKNRIIWVNRTDIPFGAKVNIFR